MTDYHIHVLPGVDDGAADVAEAEEMLALCAAQGFQVIATPHYISHRQSAEDFLKNRQAAYESIAVPPGTSVKLGAEVYIEQRFCEDAQLHKLTLADSPYILLEPPYTSFKSWIENEIYNVLYGLKLIPVIAHIERYLDWYSKDDVARLLAIKEAVIQINAESLFNRKGIKFVESLLREGRIVIFGSDAHNLTSRPPKLGQAYEILKAKLSRGDFQKIINMNENFTGR